MAVIGVRDIQAAPGEKVYGQVMVGEWSDGSAISVPIAIANGAREGTTVLLIGCMHGDEVVGTEAIRRVVGDLDPATLSGAVVAVFAANVPAYVMGTRVNGLEDPAGSNDLKRVLRTAQPEGSLTDRIACLVRDELVPLCEYYVDLHSSARGSVNHPRAIVAGDTLDADPELRGRLDLLADACDFEYVFRATAGRWKGMYFAPTYPLEEDQGKAGIVLETGYAPSMEGVDLLVSGMAKILARVGILPGESTRTVPMTLMSRLVATRANHGGMWHPVVGIPEKVDRGQLLGRIVNLRGETVEEVFAPVAGVVIKVTTTANIWTGVRTHVIAVPREDGDQ